MDKDKKVEKVIVAVRLYRKRRDMPKLWREEAVDILMRLKEEYGEGCS